MNLGGGVVVLGGDESYTQNKETGQKTRIEYEGGQRVMYLWGPSDRRIGDEEENKMLKDNEFALLATEKQEMTKDFTRRV